MGWLDWCTGVGSKVQDCSDHGASKKNSINN